MTSSVYIDSTGAIDIELEGARKVLSMRRHLLIEPWQVEKIELISDLKKPRFYTKVMGTNAWYYGGWFRENGENEFWDVKNNAHVLVITTKDFKYRHIYIEVDSDFKLD